MVSLVSIGDSTVRYLFLSLVLYLRHAVVDWQYCARDCPWNEKTWGNVGNETNVTYSEQWERFYNGTSNEILEMFCDCYRKDRLMMENRYANVHGHALSYYQLFSKDFIVGTWEPGASDNLRSPHDSYMPAWRRHVWNVSYSFDGDVDAIIWDKGHHQCGKSSYLQKIHDGLVSKAKNVFFLETIGLNACKSTPSRAQIFRTGYNWSSSDFWDGKIHLNGIPNMFLSYKLVLFLLDRNIDISVGKA